MVVIRNGTTMLSVNIRSLACDDSLIEPVVFKQFQPALDWNFSSTTPELLAETLGNESIKFRLGKKDHGSQWETNCDFVFATMKEFLDWSEKDVNSGPFKNYDYAKFWCYADYIYIRDMFQHVPGFNLSQEIEWKNLGFDERGGQDSAIWIGTKGAHTLCHYDTYGFNIVFQVYGRKRWILFPPSDTSYLYPTRLPYEESSVFSQVDLLHPDLLQHKKFMKCHPHVVVLEAGDLLFVPQHWWHFVENLELSISVNAWFPVEEDKQNRVHEAITRLLIGTCMKVDPHSEKWLNPTEDMSTHDENVDFVQRALALGGPIRHTLEPGRVLDPTTECCCRPDCEHVASGGRTLSRVCVTHATEVVPFWRNLPRHSSRNNASPESKRRKLASEIPPDKLSNVTFRDIVNCLTKPSVVRCIANELMEQFE